MHFHVRYTQEYRAPASSVLPIPFEVGLFIEAGPVPTPRLLLYPFHCGIGEGVDDLGTIGRGGNRLF